MNPDAFRARAVAYENNLPSVAEAIGLYDSTAKTYDAAKVRAEAEKQLELTAPDADPNDPTSYKNLFGYTNVDQLKATNYSLGKVIEQNKDYIKANEADPAKKVEVDRRKKENSELSTLEGKYRAALAMYNEVGAADPGRPDSERMRCSLALGLTEYGRDTKDGSRTWKDITKERIDTWGTYEIGDDADREFVAERYFPDAKKAWAVREEKKKRNVWIGLGATALTALISGLASQNGGGGDDNGGETGAPGGR
jgi:hypothetical protein